MPTDSAEAHRVPVTPMGVFFSSYGEKSGAHEEKPASRHVTDCFFGLCCHNNHADAHECQRSSGQESEAPLCLVLALI